MNATHRQQTGFTLIETIIALSVMAVLAGIAVPAFERALSRNAVRGIAMELHESVIRARLHAKGAARVVIEPVSGQWEQGWTLRRHATSGTEDVLETHDPGVSEFIRIEECTERDTPAIAFDRWGFPEGLESVSLRIFDTRYPEHSSTTVSVFAGGATTTRFRGGACG